MIAFTVHGIPAPQGSKTPWGTEANARTKPWRATVSAEAAEAMSGHTLLLGPVEVRVEFTFPRPKSHYRTGKHANELRPDAPDWHRGKPDLDKLQRAIGDALSGIVVRDDSQIAAWKVEKLYGDAAGAIIQVEELA